MSMLRIDYALDRSDIWDLCIAQRSNSFAASGAFPFLLVGCEVERDEE